MSTGGKSPAYLNKYLGESAGGEAKKNESSDEGKNNASDSISDDADEVVHDTFYANQKKAKLTRVAQDGSEVSSDVDDEIESADGEQTRRTMTDDFVVDDQDRPIQRNVIVVHTDQETKLQAENVDQVNKLFGTGIAMPAVYEQQYTMETDASRKEAVSISGINNFERNCDKVFPSFEQETRSVAEYIIYNHFQGRQSSDDEKNVKALCTIIEMMSEIPDRKTPPLVPQSIIKFHKAIYRDTIFNDEDIYTIQKSFALYNNMIETRRVILSPIEEEFKRDHGDPNTISISQTAPPEQRLFAKSMLEADNENAFSDLRRYIQFRINKTPSVATDLMFRDRKIFSQYWNEFIITPLSFADRVQFFTQKDGSLAQPPSISDPPSHPMDYLWERYAKELSIEDKAKLPFLLDRLVDSAAHDLYVEFSLMAVIRSAVHPFLVVNTAPPEITNFADQPKASELLRANRDYGRVKRLKNKQLGSFANSDSWPLIQEAKAQSLINYTIEINQPGMAQNFAQFVETMTRIYVFNDPTCPNETADKIFGLLSKNELFNVIQKVSDEFMGKGELKFDESGCWTALRVLIIRTALIKYIWPTFVSEAEKELDEMAAKSVANIVESKYLAALTANPYTIRRRVNDVDFLENSPVLCIHFSPDTRERISAVYVGKGGSIETSAVLSSLLFRRTASPIKWNDQEQIKDTSIPSRDRSSYEAQWKLKEIIEKHRPPVIAITATSSDSLSLLRKVNEILKVVELSAELVFVPCDAAKIYAASSASELEKRDLKYQANEARDILIAASSARRMQNPLSELTRLVTPTRNYLVDWAQHKFQMKYVIKGSERGPIYEAIERACLKAVSISGIDFTSLQNPHHRGSLQFVPGFGPRLSQYVLDSTFSKGLTQVNCRNRLEHQVLSGPHFVPLRHNAFPFIRFPSTPTGDNGHLLDSIILPSNFKDIASNLVNIAFDRPINSSSTPDDLAEFFKSKRNEVSQYFDKYQRLCGEIDRETFDFICSELKTGPYEAVRVHPIERTIENVQESSDPLRLFQASRARIHSSDDNFCSVMSDYDLLYSIDSLMATLTPNVSPIEVILLKVGKDGEIVCRTEASLMAYSNQREAEFVIPQDSAFPANSRAICIYCGVDTKSLTVRVTFNPDAAKAAESFERIKQIEPDFDLDGEMEEAIREEKSKSSGVVNYSTRGITHENFRDFTIEQATEELKDKDVGSFIFRPSSHGTDKLSLIMKFPGNVYADYTIVERRKSSEIQLGQDLYIENELFQDLEQIKWEFAIPIRDKLNEAMHHRKWIENYEEALDTLNSEKQSNPTMVCYRVTSSIKFPGCLLLVWIKEPGLMHEEPLRLFKDKIKYRHEDYANLNQIIDYFKTRGLNQTSSVKEKPIFQMKTDAEEVKERTARPTQQRRQFGVQRGYGR